MKTLIVYLFMVLLLGCSCSKKATDPPPELPKITAAYFPMSDHDAWFYSTEGGAIMVRSISGDTTINGIICKRVLEDFQPAQAWEIDNAGYYIRMRGGIALDPPLAIRFDMEKDKRYDLMIGLPDLSGDGKPDTIPIPIEFAGFVTKNVNAGIFNDVAKIRYPATLAYGEYYEYYGKGVGLLDDGEYSLDSAFIGGLWYK